MTTKEAMAAMHETSTNGILAKVHIEKVAVASFEAAVKLAEHVAKDAPSEDAGPWEHEIYAMALEFKKAAGLNEAGTEQATEP